MSAAFLPLFGSLTVISLVSLAGVLTLAVKRNLLDSLVFFLISLAAGALLGDIFFHLLPEMIEETGSLSIVDSQLILGGFFLFFILEKFLIWHHHHHVETPEDHQKDQHGHTCTIGFMNLLGDAFHNFLDGMLIAGSFLVDPVLGYGTAFAVLLHELPQEIGDFGVLIHSGFSVKKALLFNFLTSLSAFAGALLVLSFGTAAESLSFLLIPFTIGAFLYIAASDLIPELRKESSTSKTFGQIFALLLGLFLMYALLWTGGHSHGAEDDHHDEKHGHEHEEMREDSTSLQDSLLPGQVYHDDEGTDYELILQQGTHDH